MTDDRAARIAALQARQGAAPRPGRDGGAVSPRPTSRPARRGHAASGGRILAVGLSISAALGLVGVMAHAARSVDSGQPPSPPPAAAPVVIRVVLPDTVPSDAATPLAATVAPAAPVVAAAPVVTAPPRAATPVTTSRAS